MVLVDWGLGIGDLGIGGLGNAALGQNLCPADKRLYSRIAGVVS